MLGGAESDSVLAEAGDANVLLAGAGDAMLVKAGNANVYLEMVVLLCWVKLKQKLWLEVLRQNPDG